MFSWRVRVANFSHSGVEFYFSYRFHPYGLLNSFRWCTMLEGRVVELLGDSQIKSCLANKWNRIDFCYWETCITAGSDTENSLSLCLDSRSVSIAEVHSALHAICNNNPRSVQSARFLFAQPTLPRFLYTISTCSLILFHLLRFFACYKDSIIHVCIHWTLR